jgi:hypothetical protein
MQYVPHVSRMAEHVLHGANEGTLMVNPFATTVDNILPTQAPLAEPLSVRRQGLRFRILNPQNWTLDNEMSSELHSAL